MKRLSGWARLWIVILVPVFLLITWINVQAENARWQYACNWNGCAGFTPSPTRYNDRGEPLVEFNDVADWSAEHPNGPEALAAVQAEITRREHAQAEHTRLLLSAPLWPSIGALIAFLVAMIAKSAALWVWRGFRPPAQP